MVMRGMIQRKLPDLRAGLLRLVQPLGALRISSLRKGHVVGHASEKEVRKDD